ncbi:MAG: ABC transporter ATP-binding protein [Bdellovibrionales bacterium]|nr:ABC transporter ATP-binding protein [Bdellovibrionales bacterium]
METRSTSVLRICNLLLDIGGVRLLDSLSFEIHSGEWVGLKGVNGSGKTTLLRTVLGIHEVPRGGVFIRNRDIRDLPRSKIARSIGYMPQTLPSRPNLTVQEFFGALVCQYSNQVLASVQELPNELLIGEMNALAHKPVCGLSGGELQRVLFAAALYHADDLLLLDEPVSALDTMNRQSVTALLQQIKNSNSQRGCIITSHDNHFLESTCSRILVLENGGVYEHK